MLTCSPCRARTFRTGFTLIELLVSIGILGVLAAVVLVAINPTKQLAESRNGVRRQDSKTILSALQQYVIENGALPSGIDTTLRMIGTDSAGCAVACPESGDTTADACIDLQSPLVPVFVSGLPADPRVGSGAKSYYAVQLLPSSRLQVVACGSELEATIAVQQ